MRTRREIVVGLGDICWNLVPMFITKRSQYINTCCLRESADLPFTDS
jgi:hypothetical protein